MIVITLFTYKNGACQQTDSLSGKTLPHPIVLSVEYPQKKHSAKKAALLSAIIPGLGQAYNKRYWKIPIVYAILSLVGYNTYDIFNKYNKATNALVAFDKAANKDSVDFYKLPAEYQRLNKETVIRAKDFYREQGDQQLLWFLLCWGLNVIDAAVDAHLQHFDISDNLSLRVVPHVKTLYNLEQPMALNYGLSFNLMLHNNKKYVIKTLDD